GAARVAEGLPQHEVRTGEGAVHVALGLTPPEEHVAGHLIVEKGSTGGDGEVWIDEDGQRLVVDVDQVAGICRLRRALRAHGGDRLSHEAGALGSERRPRRRPEPAAPETWPERLDGRYQIAPPEGGGPAGRPPGARELG